MDADEEDDGFDSGAVDAGDMLECPDCNRKFNPVPFEKHVKICAKVFLQKRKKFDSTKMRVADNPELVKILTQKQREEKKAKAAERKGQGRPAAGNDETPVGGDDKKKKWEEQSKAFREAMKAARQVTAAIASGAPLPPPVMSAPDPSLIPCPHCGRRFNDKAAERHIPQCQNIKAKPSSLKRGSGITAGTGVAKASGAKASKGAGKF